MIYFESFLNLPALANCLICFGLSVITYRQDLTKQGDFTVLLCSGVALSYAVNALSALGSTEEVGFILQFSLLSIFYAIVVNTGLRLYQLKLCKIKQ